ncbi:unnamed protein product [Amoebophrya sp. A25]|nr:unnamed protein product [Amoebophrya sp. A25]|eukprot:GSA25T00020931001.1
MRLGCFPRYKLNELASIQAGFLSAPYVFRRLEFVINGLDPRGTNMYDFQFFLRLMKIWGDNTKILGADELLEAFRLLDLDRTGLISPEEIRQIMSIFGDKLSPEEAEGMLDMADLDDNGQVDYEEFVAINLQQTMQGAGNKKKVQDALEKLEKRKAAALAGEQAGGGMKGDNFLSAGGDDDFLGGGGNPNNPF